VLGRQKWKRCLGMQTEKAEIEEAREGSYAFARRDLKYCRSIAGRGC